MLKDLCLRLILDFGIARENTQSVHYAGKSDNATLFPGITDIPVTSPYHFISSTGSFTTGYRQSLSMPQSICEFIYFRVKPSVRPEDPSSPEGEALMNVFRTTKHQSGHESSAWGRTTEDQNMIVWVLGEYCFPFHGQLRLGRRVYIFLDS